MDSIVAVGSLAFDSVETPYGRADRVLGGSTNYFSLSASFFSKVRCIGVVGRDYPDSALEELTQRGIDIEGIQHAAGDTFFWVGKYGQELNEAHTLETHLNVFEKFAPAVPAKYRDSRFVFLGNIVPKLQESVLEQITGASFVALDTMNFWISSARQDLIQVLSKADAVIVNETEIRSLTGKFSVVEAADEVRRMGPSIVVVKRGEYGAILFQGDRVFALPAMPLRTLKDPTGAGDSFAGGFLGYLASGGYVKPTFDQLQRAVVFGSVMASFAVEDFSFANLLRTRADDVRRRYEAFDQLVRLPTYEISTRS